MDNTEKKQSLLTAKERELICQIASDIQTGNHLLYKRDDEYKEVWKQMSMAYHKNQQERTEKEKEMLFYKMACTDPSIDKRYKEIYF